MNTAAMQTFCALLALSAIAGSVVLAVSLWLPSVVPGLRGGTGTALVEVARGNAMRFSLLLAGTAMAGSLYFSEVANYAPCKLCWYQRICMYSIAIVSLVAVVRREASGRVRVLAPYVLSLSLVGLSISTYHYVLEWFPQLETSVCSLDVPCTTVWFRKFGFLTIPAMAWVAFASVALVMTAVLRATTPDDRANSVTPPEGD